MSYKIARHQEHITINPLEYVLDNKGNVMKFKTKAKAKAYLTKKGVKNLEGIYFKKE